MEIPKILIVEDESITALAIKHKLERLGYNVLDIESCGIDAVKKAEELEPDLILMDIILKGEIDGIETTNRINHHFDIPIIYLTAHFEDEIIEKVKLTKNYGYIVKPFSDGNLKSSIEIALHKSQMEDELLKSEDKYRKIVETANEGIWAMDHNFKTTFVNQKMAEMLGYTIEEMIGKPVTFFMLENELEDHNLKMKSREDGISEQYERRFRHKNGSEILTHVSVTALKDNKNNFAGSFALFTDITKQKKAQKDLKHSERKFKELFNNISSGVAVYESINNNEDFIFKDFNKSAEKIDKIKRKDVIGKSLLQLFPGVKDYGLFKVLQRVHETGVPEHFPASLYKDERITGWRDNYVYKLPSGEVVSAYDDITKRKNAEASLKESEKKYRTLFENTGTVTLIIEEDTTISLVNSEFEEFSGYSKDEIVNKKSWTEFIAEENELNKMKEYQKLRRIDPNKAPRNYEFKFIDKNKNIRDVFITVSIIPGTKKSLVSLLDITEKKKSREALRESEKKYRQLVENAHDGICSVNLNGIINFVNPRMAEILGYSVEEMSGAHVSEFIDEKHLEIKEILKDSAEIYKKQHDFEFFRKDGQKIHTIIETSIIQDGKDNTEGLLAMVTDVTDRINAKKEIERANIYHRGLIESSLDPMITIEYDGNIADVNTATEKVTGYKRDKLIGTEFSQYFTDTKKAREGFQKVIEKGTINNYELEIKHRTGQITPVSYNASIYNDDEGNPIGVFAAARDITELKIAEKNIKSSLKEKEVLLREIHHRVKNNLQIISSLLSLQSSYLNNNEALDVFKESQNRVKSMAMIHEMLYRSDCLVKINFGEYITELTNNLLYNYKINPNIIQIEQNIDNIYFDVDTSIPCGLIVNELVSNSLKHAFPQFKTSELLKDSFNSPKFYQGKINIELKAYDDNYMIIIADNGIGFPDNIDFRKTESLGLELVNNLVEQLDGAIELDKSEGTKFNITFKLDNYDEAI